MRRSDVKVFIHLLKVNIKKTLIYRTNFWISLFAMALWMGIYVIFFEILFMHIDDLAGWSKGEMLIFLAFYYFVQAMGNVLYRESFEIFGDKMRQGGIDFVLTKPVSKQILLFFDEIRFDHIVDFFLTALLFVYALVQTGIVIQPGLFLIGIVLAIFGNILFYGLLLLIASLLFYVDRMDGIGSFMWHLSQISRFPRQIYSGWGKWLFQFIFPLALLVSLPTEVALGRIDIKMLFYFIAISLLFFALGNLSFSLGLRRYSSAN